MASHWPQSPEAYSGGKNCRDFLRWRLHERRLDDCSPGCRGLGAGSRCTAARCTGCDRVERRCAGNRHIPAQAASGTRGRQVRHMPPRHEAGEARSQALSGVPGVPHQTAATRDEDLSAGRIPQSSCAERHVCGLPQEAACRREETAAEVLRLSQAGVQSGCRQTTLATVASFGRTSCAPGRWLRRTVPSLRITCCARRRE